jgi:hypothetical protein
VSELNKHTGWQQGQYIRLPKYEKLSQGWHEESERLERERVRPSPTGNAICVTFEPDMAKWIAERLNTAAQLESKLAAVTAERDALRQDKALVDWLDDNAGMVVYREGMFAASSEDCCNAGWYDTVRDAIKAAIDAAKGGAR